MQGVKLEVSGKMCDTACYVSVFKIVHMHIYARTHKCTHMQGVKLEVSGKMCDTA